MNRRRRVLGVDTSLRSSGVGVVEADGNRFRALHYGRIHNPASRLHSHCLRHIKQSLEVILSTWMPDEVVVEGTFFSKNANTAMILGEARGVVIAECASRDIPVYEYSPRKVKLAVVGTGTASKQQVAHMIQRMMGLIEVPQNDAADALAIAMCHLHNSNAILGTTGKQI